MKISIVTPWHNCPELLGQYLAATARADEVILVDNGSNAETQFALQAAAHGRGRVIRNDVNVWFSRACNQGLAAATGDIVVCLNSDVLGDPAWIDQVRADVADGALYGPQLQMKQLLLQPLLYLDGWCVAARQATWQALGGWAADAYPMYYSDVDLSCRAFAAGYPLRERRWPLQHLGNYTSQRTPHAYGDSDAACARFAQQWREAGRARV